MAVDKEFVSAAAAALTELDATLSSTSIESAASQHLKRKRAITPSEPFRRDIEKQPLRFGEVHRQEARSHNGKEQDTFLYLAYGSNLAYSTFQGFRGVRPLRAVNVHVPELELAFDLSAIAYQEPCMANTRPRKAAKGVLEAKGSDEDVHQEENLGWSKGLVGVVYEVTAADYKHIMETEGGGMSYADVQVPCYPLARGVQAVPDPDSYPKDETPLQGFPKSSDSATPFLAHTLLAPKPSGNSHRVRCSGWAQPSLRYLNLLRTGSREHQLPIEYIQWLESLQHYQMTSVRQRVGGTIFLCIWGPLILLLVKTGRLVANKNGNYPQWFRNLLELLFGLVWWNYDTVFLPLAGDGERTTGT